MKSIQREAEKIKQQIMVELDIEEFKKGIEFNLGINFAVVYTDILIREKKVKTLRVVYYQLICLGTQKKEGHA